MDFQKKLRIAEQVAGPQKIEIDLGVVSTDKQFNLAGNCFYVQDAPDRTSYVYITTNNTHEAAMKFTKHTGMIWPFTRLYVTTPAGQTGTLTLIVASEAPDLFAIIDHRSAISDAMEDVLGELQGSAAGTYDTEKTVGTSAVSVLAANADRKAFSVQAKSSNTGKIYLGFDNTVTASKWIAELLPGVPFMLDDYRGAVYAISDTADQKLGWGEW